MPLPMGSLEALFVEDGLKCRLEENGHLVTGFATHRYLSPAGVRQWRSWFGSRRGATTLCALLPISIPRPTVRIMGRSAKCLLRHQTPFRAMLKAKEAGSKGNRHLRHPR